MTIKVEYFSDVLCVWAWIAQRRLDELKRQFGDDIELEFRYVNVFGDTKTKIGDGWAARGGYAAFGKHVVESAGPFEDAPVSGKIWQYTRPASSVPAHTVLKAVAMSHSAADAEKLGYRVRENFFVGMVDIADLQVLLALVDDAGLNVESVSNLMNSGDAIAALTKDYQSAQIQGIKGSPSWVLDGGRQILYGNVGYRVLHANAAELIKDAPEGASWC